MSQAHRPTWNPTLGRETKVGSQQVSKLSLAQHTKLKFRQPGQNSSGDVQKRDLKAELAAAERAANEKKRKAAGLPALPGMDGALRIENGSGAADSDADADSQEAKRRKVLEEALELDKDDSDDDDEDEGPSKKADKGKGRAVENGQAAADDDDDDEEEDDDDDEWVTLCSMDERLRLTCSDDSDDDDTAELMAELAKIKQERAEEKARLVSV